MVVTDGDVGVRELVLDELGGVLGGEVGEGVVGGGQAGLDDVEELLCAGGSGKVEDY